MRDTRTNWIQTFTGAHICPLNPKAADVNIADIAHSLATQNRWTGHARVPISIAEHSTRVARRLEILGCDIPTQMAGLLHDATEAYLCDVASPVKRDVWLWIAHELNIVPYTEAERTLILVIYRGLGLSDTLCGYDAAAVHRADLEMLVTEARDLMHGTDDWPSAPTVDPLTEVIVPVDWRIAETWFLSEYQRLRERLGA